MPCYLDDSTPGGEYVKTWCGDCGTEILITPEEYQLNGSGGYCCPGCTVKTAEEPKDGIKFDNGKDRWDLLPLAPVRYIVKVLAFGAKKYDVDSWKNIKDAENRYYAAAMRHIVAWRTGEKIDPESRLPHLAHAATNLIFLLWFGDQKK